MEGVRKLGVLAGVVLSLLAALLLARPATAQDTTVYLSLIMRPLGQAAPIPGDTTALCDVIAEIPDEECEALAALYQSTNGPQWKDHSNWLATNIPSNWYGVTVTDGHVTALRLANNGLAGNLPPELGNLAFLEIINLAGNQLDGDIPPELGNLIRLKALNLGWDPILYESKNQLTGIIPGQLGNLTKLSELDLGHNRLSGPIPPELGQLVNLRNLNLVSNQLSGPIPPELGGISELWFLRLSHNELSGPIPDELGNLATLIELDLDGNQLSGTIPSTLGQLTRLAQLLVANNALIGPIPPEITQLTFLRVPPKAVVDLGYNMLWTDDPQVSAFLADKDPDWADTQTVPPTGLQASVTAAGDIELTWTPILYIGDGGYYEVCYAATSGSPYTAHGVTPDKATAYYTLSDLAPGTSYDLTVRTFTPPHGDQHTNLWSPYADELVITP